MRFSLSFIPFSNSRVEKVYKDYSKFIMETGATAASPSFWWFMYKTLTQDLKNVCSDALIDTVKEFGNQKMDKNIDIVIINNWAFGYCGSVLSHLFNSSLIIFNVAGPFSTSMLGLGNSVNPFTQPNLIAPYIEPMTFTERLVNVVMEYIVTKFMSWTDLLGLDVIRKELGEEIPEFSSIVEDRATFSFANSHFVTHGSWPYYKNFIELGGIHCKPGKILPDDLKEYMDYHTEGVVYVSFGSGFKPSQMTKTQRNTFHEAFRELNYPIIWIWDGEDLNGIPENVKIMKWVPQNDLLAHPNLKAFLTQGGLMSIQEALFHKVPLVGIPITADQAGNLKRAEANGYAVKLNLHSLTKYDLVSAIRKVMTDETVINSISRMHELFTDYYDQTPMEKGLNAIEYVLRNRNLDFMKPKHSINIPWYQYYGFDIVSFIVISVVFVIFIVTKLFLLVFQQFKCKKEKEE